MRRRDVTRASTCRCRTAAVHRYTTAPPRSPRVNVVCVSPARTSSHVSTGEPARHAACARSPRHHPCQPRTHANAITVPYALMR
jgi:hypothetical protein